MRETFEGHGLASNVRYLSPMWAMVLIPRNDDDKMRIITRPTEIVSLAIYLRYSDTEEQ